MSDDSLAVYLFHNGDNYDAHSYMGAHRLENKAAVFRVWAKNADSVSVVGDFNDWDGARGRMTRVSGGGIFEVVIHNVSQYDCYKYEITSSKGVVRKADPYAFHAETKPATASKFYELKPYAWSDGGYAAAKSSPYSRPVNIYEVNLASWRRHKDGNPFTYAELARELPQYASDMGYTHIELMPVTEHPFDGSWGYQATGYFAPTSRYGTPDEFKLFVDSCHALNIGVILDWVPSHFCMDEFGLIEFDGSYAYEYADELKREHRDWGTRVFDFGKPEVRSFLISNACYWLGEYHIDGLRVDAVASMLYLDYGRKEGEWRKNSEGGNHNLEAVSFLKALNTAVFSRFPYALMCAEESTAWPKVTGRVSDGALGFNYKWNMGWMNDMLSYMSLDPLFRKGSHNKLTFSMMYAFSESFILPLSHDEVVHGKCSLINKMPGDYGQKFKNLRAFAALTMAHPGKKLSFMGNELAQFIEWADDRELDWLLLDYEAHRAYKEYIKRLNRAYLDNPPLWEIEDGWDGFMWLNPDDYTRSTISFMRTDKAGNKIAVICNLSGSDYNGYTVPMPDMSKRWRVMLDSSNDSPPDRVYKLKKKPCMALPCSIDIDIPALTAIYLKGEDL